MSTPSSMLTRRTLLATSAAAGALSIFPGEVTAALDSDSIRSFHIDVPEKDLADLRRRIVATRWPDQETVPDRS